MTKENALHQFFSRWGLKARDAGTVPDKSKMPYITYDVAFGDLYTPSFVTLSIWDYSTSWSLVTEIADNIYTQLGVGGTTIPYDGGMLWLTRGSPFMQRVADPDSTVRRILLSINMLNLSSN